MLVEALAFLYIVWWFVSIVIAFIVGFYFGKRHERNSPVLRPYLKKNHPAIYKLIEKDEDLEGL